MPIIIHIPSTIINVFRLLLSENPFIDSGRMAVIGKNYGGFLATSLLTQYQVHVVELYEHSII